jgi:hypothetical protein
MENWVPWLIPLAAQVVLVWRLLFLGLASHYRAFTALQIALLSEGLLLMALQAAGNQNLYAQTFFSFEVVIWGLEFAALAELFAQVLKRYPGLSKLGRRLLRLGLALSLIIFAWEALPRLIGNGDNISYLPLFFAAQKTAMICQFGFLALIVCGMFLLPLRLFCILWVTRYRSA